jgi:CRP/FNR family transcriptional regulator
MTDEKIIPISSLRVSCEKCSLKSLCLPQGLAGLQIGLFEDIVGQLPPMHDKKYLYRQDDKFVNLYVVRSGCVKQYQSAQDGTEHVIGFSLPGELLGIDAIATGHYRESAVTLDTSSVCKLEYGKFEELCEKIPGLTKQMMKMVSQELTQEHDLRMTISTKNSEERLAIFISSLSTRFQLLGYSANEFILPMSRGDIGDYLGIAIETVSRVSRKLVEQGLIEVNRRSIKIKDPDGLKSLAGHCEVCPSRSLSKVS